LTESGCSLSADGAHPATPPLILKVAVFIGDVEQIRCDQRSSVRSIIVIDVLTFSRTVLCNCAQVENTYILASTEKDDLEKSSVQKPVKAKLVQSGFG